MDENDDDADIRNAEKLLVAGQPVTAPDPDEEPAPDAMRLPDWPMKLALGWIMTRSANFVGDLLRKEPEALLDLDLRHTLFRANGGAGISRGEAAVELWAALSEGSLTGSAIIDGARAELAPIQWQDFRLAEGSGRLGSPQGHIVLVPSNGGAELARPSFRRDDIRSIWLAADASSAAAVIEAAPEARSPRRLNLSQVTRDYQERVRAIGDGKKPSREPDYATMKELHPGITHEIIAELRSKHAPAEWSMPGRPRKARG